MRILILGGTEFVGTALVQAALDRGAAVTTLTRGTHPPASGVTALVGDRREPARRGLAAVLDEASRSGRWDLVVDTWSWEPFAVRDSARVLAPLADRYALVSSRSVYADPLPAGADESVPLVPANPSDGDPVAVAAETGAGTPPELVVDYARGKAGAELALRESFGDRALLLRPGLVLGPRENVGRLPWWLSRIARGGDVLAPGVPDAGIQYVDARDLAEFALDAGLRGASGAFNVVTPPGRHTLGELLAACIDATGSDARLRWVAEERILAAGIEPWTELPIWLPAGPDHDAMHRADVSAALAAGLRFRPLTETVADTWCWLRAIGGAAPLRLDRPPVGLDAEKEHAVLSARKPPAVIG
ncbi:Rossmann-fold NAD(P)-binding domain-containing protein [Herbiconiux ginsengi]|uniref:Nucleoside-diphosphate-sugar epimerase n=1 Tax=Herbiconiux ginsengi TaxID=381665 RepID=A0A1H3Q7U0_9MICO|nr:reductase [Herbiconiux ginsengi]SDZ09436.1 Nucleoside-diphosphate-sugar epimerase [Herbiconiux ginsengi]